MFAHPRAEINTTETCSSSMDEFPNLFSEEQLRDGGIVLAFAIGIYCFTLLAIICDSYFLPCVERICEALNLSQVCFLCLALKWIGDNVYRCSLCDTFFRLPSVRATAYNELICRKYGTGLFCYQVVIATFFGLQNIFLLLFLAISSIA